MVCFLLKQKLYFSQNIGHEISYKLNFIPLQFPKFPGINLNVQFQIQLQSILIISYIQVQSLEKKVMSSAQIYRHTSAPIMQINDKFTGGYIQKDIYLAQYRFIDMPYFITNLNAIHFYQIISKHLKIIIVRSVSCNRSLAFK